MQYLQDVERRRDPLPQGQGKRKRPAPTRSQGRPKGTVKRELMREPGGGLIPTLSEVAGAAEAEARRGISAADYLSWARAELVGMYEASSGDDEDRVLILREISRNISAAARAAAELRTARIASYKSDPAFGALWRTMQEVLREFPEAAARMEELIQEQRLSEALPGG